MEEKRWEDKATSIILQCPDRPSTVEITNRDGKNKEPGVIVPGSVWSIGLLGMSHLTYYFLLLNRMRDLRPSFFRLENSELGSSNVLMQVSKLGNGNQDSNLGLLS